MALTHPLLLLLLVPFGVLAAWAWYTGDANLSARRHLVSLLLRLLLLVTIVLGLAGLSVQSAEGRQTAVFVADVSASDSRQVSSVVDEINSAAARRPAGDNLAVVATAADAAVEQPPGPLSSFDGFSTHLDPSTTNLERGMELAGAILPDGYRRHVVLISDGQQTEGDAVIAAQLLHVRGVRVDVLPEHVRAGPDVAVDRVTAPSILRTGERSSVGVQLRSTEDVTTQIDLYRDRDLIDSRTASVHVGSNHVSFPQGPLLRGFHTYEVRITPAVDGQRGNNVGSAFTDVGGPPRVLVVAGTPSEARNVVAGLRSTGIEADVKTPGSVDPSLASLQRYASIVIVNTAAEILGQDLMRQLVPYVRDLGHGLVVVGGQQSYGLGGYGQTPLAQALPVSVDLPKRPDLPSVGVALLIESLEASLPINISKSAAKGVVQLLTEEDRVAVNAVPDQGSNGWVVRLRPVTERAAIDRSIDAMQPGDPQTYVPALRAAFEMLSTSPTRLRHIILLGDGDAHDPQYKSLATYMRKHGTTISTVATNAFLPGDKETMQSIARAGGGRFYNADSTKNIPRIFLHEARTVARSGVVTGGFTPRVVSDNPMIKDFRQFPALGGYVATTPKRRAEIILTSGKLDPILAGWQFGLGRAVAWTSDSSGLWTRDFLRTPGSNRFWSALASWTMPAGQGNSLFVSAGRTGSTAHLSVDVPSTLGTSPRVVARVVTPSGQGTTVALAPTAPGSYGGTFSAGSPGAYVVTVEASGAGHAALGRGGIDVSYPDEYRATGTNTLLLRAVAAAGGGTVLRDASEVWSAPAPTVYDEHSLSDALLVTALLLLLLDVATRRLVFDRRDIRALRGAIARIRSPEKAA